MIWYLANFGPIAQQVYPPEKSVRESDAHSMYRSLPTLIVISLVFAVSLLGQEMVFTTLAGQAGSYGYVDGIGPAARFDGVQGIAVNSTGTIYVVDNTNNLVRRVTAAGEVSTVATVSQPWGIALPNDNDIYVTAQYKLTRLRPDGSVAAFYEPWTLDYTPTDSHLDYNNTIIDTFSDYYNYLSGPIAVTSGGVMYSVSHSAIRTITAGGKIRPFVGAYRNYQRVDGSGWNARFNDLPNVGLALDSGGNLYLADTYSNAVRKVTPSGGVSTLATVPGPVGLCVDQNNNIYVVDNFDYRVNRISPAGVVTFLGALPAASRRPVAGIWNRGPSKNPAGIAVDRSGVLYVTDGATVMRFGTAAVDLSVISAKWDPAKGGLSLVCHTEGLVTQTVTATFYWANGTGLNNRFTPGAPFYTAQIPPTPSGKNAEILVPAEALTGAAPTATTHVIVVVNEENLVPEIERTNNVRALADVALRGLAINAYSREVVKRLLRQAGQKLATVTSTQRTPYDQARVMFDNELAKQSPAYRQPGRDVLAVYKQMTVGKNPDQIRAIRPSIISAMEAKIRTFDPTTQVSRHCGDPAVLTVLDVAPSDFGPTSSKNFARRALAATGTVSAFLGPKWLKIPGLIEDPRAFHLEIPQSAGLPQATADIERVATVGESRRRLESGVSREELELVASTVPVAASSGGVEFLSGTVSTGQTEFQVQASRGDRLWLGLTVTGHRQGTVADDSDTVVYLLDSSNRILDFNDDDIEGGFDSSIENFSIPADGAYKIVVVTYGNAPILDSSNRVTGWQGTGGSNVDFSLSLLRSPSPEMVVEQPAGVGLPGTAATVRFRDTFEGASADLVFTIKNRGQGDLADFDIAIDGADADSFTVSALPGDPVSGPNGSTTFTVRFAPASAGAKTAVLHVSSNNSSEATFDVTLNGSGLSSAFPNFAWRNPLPEGGTLQTVIHAQDRFVAGGVGGRILTSPDGAVWSLASTIPGFSPVNALCYTGALYVAVGGGGRIFTSSDAVVWTQRGQANDWLNGVAFADNRYVAVGYNGRIMGSSDGVTWVARTSPTTGAIQGVAGTTGRFVAVGDNGLLLTSTDATTWSVVTPPSGYGATSFVKVAYFNGQFVIVGASGAILTSANGTTWVARTTGFGGSVRGVVYQNFTYVACTDSGTVLASTDLATWTQTPLPSIAPQFAIAAGGGSLVTVGAGGEIFSSANSTAWTSRGSVGAAWVNYDVAFLSSQFVAVGSNGFVTVSPDGVSWTRRTTNTGHWLNGVAFGAGLYVAITGYGDVLTSPETVAWTDRNLGDTVQNTGIVFANGKFVVVGSGGKIRTSADGITWTNVTGTGITDNLWSVTALGSLLVAVGDNGKIYTSPNGTAWTARASGTNQTLNRVRAIDGTLFALGNNRTVLISTDGVTWVAIPDTVTSSYGHRDIVRLTDGYYVASSDGWLVKTADLRSWTTVGQIAYQENLNAASVAAGKLVLAAQGGTLLESRLPVLGAAPAIAVQPMSREGFVGTNVILSVLATGTGPLGYQWKKNGVAISGATSAIYLLPDAQAAATGYYTVVVSGPGGSPVTSEIAKLGMPLPSSTIAIGTQPLGAIVAVGQSATFTVAATGVGSLTYQWRRNGFPIPGATASSYIRTAVTLADADFYDVVIADGAPSFTESAAARLVVTPTAYPGALTIDSNFELPVESDQLGSITAVVPYSATQLIVTGDFIRVGGNAALRRIARLNLADGSLDASFIASINFTPNAVVALPDGKVLVGGNFTFVNGVARSFLVRFNADGSLDPTFNPGGAGPNSTVSAIVRQFDGKVIIGGGFTSYNGSTANRICRLNADGTLDSTTFSVGTSQGFNSVVSALALDPVTGNIVAGGSFTAHSDGTVLNRIARLTPAGVRDTTFLSGAGTGFDNNVNALAFDGTTSGSTAGTMLVGGAFTAFGTTANVNRLVRLTSAGAIDSAFVTGTGLNNTVSCLAYDSAGQRWIVGGSFTSYNGNGTYNRLIRLGAGGALDAGFNPNASSTVLAAHVRADSSVLIGGAFFTVGNGYARLLARLAPDGTRDASLATAFRSPGNVNRILPLPGGKILVGGSFTHFGTSLANNLARLNADLSVDLTFAPGGGSGYLTPPTVTFAGGGGITAATATATLNTSGQITGIVLTNGGTGYSSAPAVTVSGGGGVGGSFAAVVSGGVVTAVNLVQSAAGPNGNVQAAELQGDGRIVLGGSFTSFNGISANRVVRLNPDWSPDPSFNVGAGANNTVTALVPLPGGGLYVGGNFGNFNNASPARAGVVRLNTDGTLDPAFNAGTSAFNVNALAVQYKDWRLVAGGNFSNTTVNGAVRNNLVRFNRDGTLDSGFLAAGANSIVRTVAVQNDTRILIGGDFTSYNGSPVNYLARLNYDGTLDSSLGTGPTLNGSVYHLQPQEDGKLLLFGAFNLIVSGSPNINTVGRVVSATGLFDPVSTLTGVSVRSLTQPAAFQVMADGSVLAGVNTFTLSNRERWGLVRLVPAVAPVISAMSVASARPGQSITLTGSGFADATAVRFNGVFGATAITFAVNSPTSITVTIPANAASGPVVVQTPAGNGLSLTPLSITPDFQLRNPQTTASSFEAGVAYGNGWYVAATLSGSIWRSPDGMTWAQRFSGPNGLNGLAFAAGQFTAVGNSGVIFTSANGFDWTQRVLLGNPNLTGVAHDGTRWLAVSTGTGVATSIDGVNWSLVTSNGGSANSVAYGAGLFVSAGNGGVIRTSADGGLTWIARTANAGSNNLNEITFANNLFLAGGASGTLVTSLDGITWTTRTSNTTSGIYGAAYYSTGGKFLVAAQDNFLASTDGGVSWTSTGLPSGNLRALVYAGGQLVGVGNRGSIATSSDGINWQVRQTNTARAFRDFAYGNGRYVGVSQSNATCAFSTDGVTWFASTVDLSNRALNSIAYGNGLFAAVGSTLILTSAGDGPWINRTPVGSFTLNGVAFGNGVFVAVGNSGTIYRSIDAVIWSAVTSTGTANTLNAVAYGAGMFVAAGAGGTVVTSSDGGVTWSLASSGVTDPLNAVRYAGNCFILVGANSKVLVSQAVSAPAGLVLAGRAFPTAGINLTGVAFGDNCYVAVSSTLTGSYFVSTDTVTWTTVTPAADVFNLGGTPTVFFDNGRFVAAANNGIILSTPLPVPVSINTQPVALSVVQPGGSSILSVAASGASLTYQWYAGFPGDTSTPVGTNSPTFTTPAINQTQYFWVRVTGAGVSADSAAAIVVLPGEPRFASLSTLSLIGVGEEATLLNFTIEGGPKSVLARAVGPALTVFGISKEVANPLLTLHDATGAQIAQNDDWGGSPQLSNTMAAVGAFPLAADSKDSALAIELSPGVYTVRITAADGVIGKGLAELYEVGGSGRFAHLASRSALKPMYVDRVSTGLILKGAGAKSLLIRAVGTPLLTSLGALSNPSLRVYNTYGGTLAVNDDWAAFGDLSALAAATATVGGLALAPGDSAALLTLPDGGYTSEVSGENGASGFVLTELFMYDAARPAQFAPALLAPLLNRTASVGDTVYFSAPVVAKPAAITYQWKKNGNPIAGSPIPDFPGMFFILSAKAADTGIYTVTMTNAAGTTVSAPFTLAVGLHTADTNLDFRLSLLELTRVIELYNTRSGTVRTGRYLPKGGTEDGFSSAPALTTLTPLARYHSSDANQDGAIGLFELTRLIELYNTRAGTTRTGAYRAAAGTEDGFAPGP